MKTFKLKNLLKPVKLANQSVKNFFRGINIFIIGVMLFTGILPLVVLAVTDYYYFSNTMVRNEINDLQIRAVVLEDEMSGYPTMDKAKENGVFAQYSKYASLNALRIRVMDRNYQVIFDSYEQEVGRFLVNPRAIEAMTTLKSVSNDENITGVIETAVPVMNMNGELQGIFLVSSDITEVNTNLRQLTDRTHLVVIMLAIMLMIFCFVITRLISRKFTNLQTTLDEVADGHTDVRLKKVWPSEYARLATSFNEILDNANKTDESRQEFVSNVSHELKTPMTSMKVLADSLNGQQDVPVELYQEFMQDIAKEIDRENQLIENLLALVRMDKSVAKLNITSVNVNNLMQNTVRRLNPIASKKNIELMFESYRPVVAEIDEIKFTQVITNLIENAIKYGKEHGWVHITLNADYQYMFITVEDNGIGIPEESQNRIFDRFYRVDKARSRETGGTGLGLSIVKGIVLQHHGSIKVYSEEADETTGTEGGTTFTVRIPLNYAKTVMNPAKEVHGD